MQSFAGSRRPRAADCGSAPAAAAPAGPQPARQEQPSSNDWRHLLSLAQAHVEAAPTSMLTDSFG